MMLTIFTPTYNRVKLLPRLYESLCSQENQNFEWLIIDDGSTDNTAELVKEFIAEQKVNIRYIQKINGGKHTAHNVALEHATGSLFMCLDSDDTLAKNAIQIIENSLFHLTSNDCGFIAYKNDVNGQQLCGDLSCNGWDHRTIYKYSRQAGGEFAFVFLSDKLRQYPYPEIINERFCGECVVYDQLDLAGYTVCPLCETLEICEYQSDGLSKSFYRLLSQNPTGYQIYHAQRIDLVTSFRERLRHAISYQAFLRLSGRDNYLYGGRHKLLAALAWLPGQLGAMYYKKKGTC